MSLGLLRALFITNPLIIALTLVMGPAVLLVSLFETTGRMQIEIARTWCRLILIIAGVKVKVEGLEKIDPHGSYVFASNHLSYLDTPVVQSRIPARFRFLAKDSLFRAPIFGMHMRRAGHIPVSRDDPRAALRTMVEAGKTIRERCISVLLFPEGNRSRAGMRPFKEGAAYLAIQAGVPLVPLALQGTRDRLPIGTLNIRPGTVWMKVGDPIPTEHLTSKDRHRLNAALQERVAEMLGERVEAVQR